MQFTRDAIVSYLGEHIRETHLSSQHDPVYESAVFDSREAVKDIIFIAIDGLKSAGVFYVVDAIERGATAVVANISYRNELDDTIKKYSETVDFFLVDDSMISYGLLGQLAREQFSGDVIGIIGSVGKTTTKNILRELGGGQLIAHASRGSYNNQTGVPLTLCAIPNTATRAIVELGESHFGDLTYITQFAQPTIVVITNVAEAHIEFLGDLRGVAQTMNETVSLVKETGTIVVPYDITHRDIVLENAKASLVYVIDEDVLPPEDVPSNARVATITNVHAREDLSHEFDLDFDGVSLHLHIPIIGRHFVIDAALGAVAMVVSGEDADVLASRLEDVAAQGHRMLVIPTTKLTIVDDCYNANPASMKASMKAVADMATLNKSRSVFVMGPMRELGDESDRHHVDLASYARDVGIDVLVCVDPATLSASEGIHPDSHYFASVQECCDKISSLVQNGDFVGVKASRGPNADEPAMVPIVEFFTELK